MKEPSHRDSVDFAAVLEQELKQFDDNAWKEDEKPSSSGKSKHARNVRRLNHAYRCARKARLVGLAFSGGGIRSATFNLGILQGLTEKGLLRMFHYLSTVSGGGYIGAWLQAWITRRGEGNLQEVEDELRPRWLRRNAVEAEATDRQSEERRTEEAGEIRFLRKYSNYLTPRVGWFGADMWTVIAIYLRNFVLNLLLLVAAFGGLLLVCHFVGDAGSLSKAWLDSGQACPKVVTVVLPLVLVFWSTFWIVANLRYQDPVPPGEDDQGPHRPPPQHRFYTKSGFIQGGIILPLLLSAILAQAWLDGWVQKTPWVWLGWAEKIPWIWWGGIPAVYVALTLPLLLLFFHDRSPFAKFFGDFRETWNWSGYFAAVGFGFLAGVGLWLARTLPLPADLEPDAVFYPPLALFIFTTATFIYVGLRGSSLATERREWWSRFNAFCLVWCVAWIVVMGVALLGPGLTAGLYGLGKSQLAFSSATVAWVITTVGGVWAAKSASSSERGANWLLKVFATVAPYIFILGLFLLLSWAAAGLLKDLAYETGASGLKGSFVAASVNWLGLGHESGRALAGGLILFGVAALLSRWLDVNEFSMHMMYRNRLARCYLGASNRNHERHPFTGFNPTDDCDLATLRRKKPTSEDNTEECAPEDADTRPPKIPVLYPIINTTLNLVGGRELAWQKRKAAAFAFTPDSCGYDSAGWADDRTSGYCWTKDYASDRYPVKLGMATGISGAAANPNMGHNTSPASAFLLTLFNVRLGWWIGNPAHEVGRKKSSPRITLLFLLSEMLGLTSATREFVHLSDGGHFENLGIYELVRRRCRFIVACDAEQDADLEFEGLGNAIEKCRTDLGVEINLNVDPIRDRNAEGYSQWHWAVGTIDYGRPEDRGIIVFIKASLTGDAPEDILRYAAKNEEFPHQSTSDQWFDETQFESYRRLGQHIVEQLLESYEPSEATRKERPSTAEIEDLFVGLKKRWYPPAPETRTHFSKHADTVTKLYDKLRNRPHLNFLSHQFYPEWERFVRRFETGEEEDERETSLLEADEYPLPRSYVELRHGFYFCGSLIHLMEEVYLDLNLEVRHDHPDNSGWINLFKHWSWSSMFRVTWTVTASTHGSRFRSFCQRRLGLELGRVRADELALKKSGRLAEKSKGRLNFFENDLVEGIMNSASAKRRGRSTHKLYAFEITPEPGDPPAESGSAKGEKSLPSFTVGFCVLRNEEEIVFFRIQDHLRQMGLARRAVEALMKSTGKGSLVVGSLTEANAVGDASKAGEAVLREIVKSVEIDLDRNGATT